MDSSLANAFKKFDVNGDGSISKKELWDSIHSSQGLTKKDFDALFKAIDTDHSGSINLEEYSTFLGQVQHMISKNEDNKKRRKSCMKVATHRDSLSSSIDRPKKKQDRHDSQSTSMRQLSLRSMFPGFRRQKSVKKLELDASMTKDKPLEDHSPRFFDVEVREYEVTVSDNPGVKRGVALELGWSYNVLERTHLDNFEEKRGPERAKNFTKEKKLTRLERETILKEFGATQKEIQDAAKRAASIRNARKKSIGMRHHDKLYEDAEKITKPFKKMFGRLSVSKEPKVLNVDRLHPTLMAMLGANGENNDSSHASSIGGDDMQGGTR